MGHKKKKKKKREKFAQTKKRENPKKFHQDYINDKNVCYFTSIKSISCFKEIRQNVYPYVRKEYRFKETIEGIRQFLRFQSALNLSHPWMQQTSCY